MFHKISFVEKWGKGISLILSKEPTADFKEFGRQFISVFKRKHIKMEKGAEKWSEKWSELSDRQKGILEVIKENSQITRKELSANIGINQSAIQKHLDKLKQKGILKRIGPDKGGYWEVISS